MAIKGVFLDTNVFESAKFEFIKNNIDVLIKKCEEYDLSIYLNDIVKNEVFSRIAEKAKDVVSGIENHKLKYISNIYSIPNKKDEIRQQVEKDLVENFKNFLQKDVIEFIPIEYDDKVLLDMYFNKKKPFEEKKKHEFPDAMIGLSLNKYANDNEEKIIFVSNDNGLNDIFDKNIIVTKYISNAIELINKEFSVNEIFNKYENKFIEEIKSFIQEQNNNKIEFIIHGYYHDDDIEANMVEINDINIVGIYSSYTDDENKVITIACEVELDFNIETEEYPDYENGIYDKEDDLWVTFSKIQTNFNLKKVLIMEFEIIIEDFLEIDFYIEYIGDSIEIEFYERDLIQGTDIINEHFIEYR